MTGPLWFAGGSGADTFTGGTGPNTYVYGAASESTANTTDVIANFNVSIDIIDLTGIGGSKLSFQTQQLSGSIAADTIGWRQNGGNTFIYANRSSSSEALSSADMQLQLKGNIALSANNFHL
jgi:Ca2+-binding RTX toxin-like protein